MYSKFHGNHPERNLWTTDVGLMQVHEFHACFEIPIQPRPIIPNKKRCELRLKLLREEIKELEDWIAINNIVEVFDALLDIQYVLDGTFIEFGMHKIKPFGQKEVHQSNMSKLDPDGMPIIREDGKVLKGPNFFPPNLRQFL